MLVTEENALTVRQLRVFIKRLADYCFDPDALRYRDIDLVAVLDGVCALPGARLPAGARQQVVIAVADALPPGEAVWFPDAVDRVAAWLERRNAQEAKTGYRGALHDLLTHAWQRLNEDAAAEPRQLVAVSVQRSIEQMRAEMSIAEQLYLVAHDAHTGAALVHDVVLGTAVAAGLLAELLVANRIRLSAEPVTWRVRIEVLTEEDHAKARALHELLEQLEWGNAAESALAGAVREGAQDMRWSLGPPARLSDPAAKLLQALIRTDRDLQRRLAELARTEGARMRDYLIEAGGLTRFERGGRFGRASYRLLEPQLPHAIHSAITSPLVRGEMPSGDDAVVMELIYATRLHANRRADWARLARIHPGASLADDVHGPELQQLLAAAASAVSAQITSPR